MKKIYFSVLLSLVTIATVTGLIFVAVPSLQERYQPLLLEYMASNLSEQEKQKIYQQLAQKVGGLWDVIPDPQVGRIGQKNLQVVLNQADVSMNNAGLRSSVPYLPKPSDEFRIVCLGDSFVFGAGGKEQDRFCDQIESYYSRHGVLVDGKTIKTLALGVGSWTMQQEAHYLWRRLSEYAPDIILVLSINNDIGANSGVTGRGALTSEFSPEQRLWGSATLKNQLPLLFGVNKKNLLDADLSPLSEKLWMEAINAQKGLSTLQQSRGKKILFSVLDTAGGRNNLFIQTYYKYFDRHGVDAPVITVPYNRSSKTKLPHDGHPNRYGHEILSHFYIQAFHQLGWVPIGENILSVELLPLNLEPDWDVDKIKHLSDDVMEKELFFEIDFTELEKQKVVGLLGGVFPEHRGKKGLKGPIWASTRSAWLLKTIGIETPTFELTLRLPEKIELYPLKMQFVLNGQLVRTEEFLLQDAGEKTLEVDIPGNVLNVNEKPAVLEVVVYADKHFSGIEDHRMKSFQLLKSRVY